MEKSYVKITTPMVDWKDYKEQSKVDMEACNILFKKADYGNSAYHLQQSLEKYVKAILLHSNTISFSRTHIPLSESANEILPAFQKIEQISKKHGVTVGTFSQLEIAQNAYLDQCQKLLVELNDKKKKESAKIALWKNSLGIPLDKQEQVFFSKYSHFTIYYRFSLRAYPKNSDAQNI